MGRFFVNKIFFNEILKGVLKFENICATIVLQFKIYGLGGQNYVRKI